jgi:hypothetical protein
MYYAKYNHANTFGIFVHLETANVRRSLDAARTNVNVVELSGEFGHACVALLHCGAESLGNGFGVECAFPMRNAKPERSIACWAFLTTRA